MRDRVKDGGTTFGVLPQNTYPLTLVLTTGSQDLHAQLDDQDNDRDWICSTAGGLGWGTLHKDS